jgi:hypothetical protein
VRLIGIEPMSVGLQSTARPLSYKRAEDRGVEPQGVSPLDCLAGSTTHQRRISSIKIGARDKNRTYTAFASRLQRDRLTTCPTHAYCKK